MTHDTNHPKRDVTEDEIVAAAKNLPLLTPSRTLGRHRGSHRGARRRAAGSGGCRRARADVEVVAEVVRPLH